MSKVFISAGHGGSDSGAVGNGFLEKDLNLSIALHCRDVLIGNGVNVKMSRTTDEDDGINEEARESNAFAPDLTVSIHNNAGGGDGVEAWYSVVGGTSKVLAENILSEVTKIGQNSRGAKCRAGTGGSDYYGFIRQTNAPAVIVECAFIDNSEDIKIIDTEAERKTMGEAIAKGILNTLGVQPQPEPQPAPQPTPEGFIYAAHPNGIVSWYPPVNGYSEADKENGYAGMFGHSLDAVAVNLEGVEYRAHTVGGGWLPAVNGFNYSDVDNGYAGIGGKNIDGFMIRCNGKSVKYKVHLLGGGWLPEVSGYNVADSVNGYAGILGKPIDAIMIKVV